MSLLESSLPKRTMCDSSSKILGMTYHSGKVDSSSVYMYLMTDDKNHDRSQGYGSLSIWIKHIKDGLHFHKMFNSSEGYCPSNWTGSAITIGGGYVWKDAYDFASKHRHVVVGGADPVSSH